METISIAGLDKAELLVALYARSKVRGMGFLQARDAPLTVTEARQLLVRSTRFDYLLGRVMKVDLSSDTLWPRLYDRDNGYGAAQEVVTKLQEGTSS